jgi:hypothetical protein
MLLVIESRFVLSFFSPLTKTSKLSPNSPSAMNMVLEFLGTSMMLLGCIVLLSISTTHLLNFTWLVVYSTATDSSATSMKRLDCFVLLHCEVIRGVNNHWANATEKE